MNMRQYAQSKSAAHAKKGIKVKISSTIDYCYEEELDHV